VNKKLDDVLQEKYNLVLPLSHILVLRLVMGSTNPSALLDEANAGRYDGRDLGLSRSQTEEFVRVAFRMHKESPDSLYVHALETTFDPSVIAKLKEAFAFERKKPSVILREAAEMCKTHNFLGCAAIERSARDSEERSKAMMWFERFRPTTRDNSSPWFCTAGGNHPEQFTPEVRGLRVKALEMAAWLAEQAGE